MTRQMYSAITTFCHETGFDNGNIVHIIYSATKHKRIIYTTFFLITLLIVRVVQKPEWDAF